MALKVQGILDLDGRGWVATLNRAENQVNRLAGGPLGGLKSQIAAAFTIGALVEFTRRIAEAAGNIKDLSEQTGISTKDVQKLEIAAARSGLKFEDMATALSKMGAARREAAEGNDALRQMFDRYGVSLADLQDPTKNNLELLQQMSEALLRMEINPAVRQEMRDLLGKAGDKLITVIQELNNQKTPSLISDDDIEQIDKATKKMEEFWIEAKGQGAGSVGGFSQILNGIQDAMKNGLKGKPALDIILGWMKLGLNTTPSGVGSGSLNSALDAARGEISKPGGSPFVTRPASGGKLYEDKAAQKAALDLAEQEEQLQELAYQRAYNKLTTEQKRVQLQKEYNQLLIDAAAISASSEPLANELRIKAGKKAIEMDGLKAAGGVSNGSDSLTRVGNFLGSAGNIPQIQEKILTATRENSAATTENTKALNAHTAAMRSTTNSDGGYPPT